MEDETIETIYADDDESIFSYDGFTGEFLYFKVVEFCFAKPISSKFYI